MKHVCLFMLLACAGNAVTNISSASPLFDSLEPLDIVITAPFSQLRKGREAEELEEFAAILGYQDAEAGEVRLDIKLRARGNFRRSKDTCSFPPLRLNFAKKKSSNTLFKKQDKVKLVTQCQNSTQFEKLVVREYLAYRTFNILTDKSFKVRLVNASYVNSDSGNKSIRHQAFLIEDKKRLARRLDAVEHHAQEIGSSEVASDYTAIVNLFEYMIGNTDWSMFISRPGEECCHNLVPLQNEDKQILPVPYDFDFSGAVNAPYALPPPGLKIRRVTQRLFRGRCAHNAGLDAAVQLFQEKKPAIYALYEQSVELDDKSRKKALAYYDKFYAVLDDPKQFFKKVKDKCLGPRSS